MDAHEKPDEPCLLDCIFLRRFATSDGSSKEFFIEKLPFQTISFVLKNVFPKRIQFFCSWNSLSSISSRVIAAQTLSMIIQKFSFFQVFFCWGSASFAECVQVGFCRVPDAVQKLFSYFPDPVLPRFHEPFESVLLCPQPRIKSMLSFPQSCEEIIPLIFPCFSDRIQMNFSHFFIPQKSIPLFPQSRATNIPRAFRSSLEVTSSGGFRFARISGFLEG